MLHTGKARPPERSHTLAGTLQFPFADSVEPLSGFLSASSHSLGRGWNEAAKVHADHKGHSLHSPTLPLQPKALSDSVITESGVSSLLPPSALHFSLYPYFSNVF